MADTLRYPIGIQTFADIRRDGYLYIDKTTFLHELRHSSGKTYFLSRPRRFGKSLLLSTMQAYWEGRRDLFKGLAVDAMESDWEPRPVVRLDLSTVKTRDVAQLPALLDTVLRRNEERFGIRPSALTPGGRLVDLIRHARAQAGRRAVVLVDEYDAPLLNVVHDAEALGLFRDVMREFYAPLKACDEDLEFVFITGITKFSQLSIFSELNNMRNISMDPRYAAICGIAEEELVTQMQAGVQAFAQRTQLSEEGALAVLKKSYDGYHFTAPSPDIYNPFSLLSALESGNPKAYWFETGTPTFLLELLKRCRWDMTTLQDCEAPEDSFDAAAEELSTPLPMLYQGGYLTIKDYDPYSQTYSLGIPNAEVSQGLSKCFVRTAAPEAMLDHHSYLTRVSRALRCGDLEGALQATRSYLAGIPYHLGSRDERGFETTFYLIFDLLGIQIETEFKTATGRVDAVVSTPERLYVLEFKYDGTAEKALAQIDEKGYLVPFEADGRTLVKAGVNFSSAEQTIDEWVIEER